MNLRSGRELPEQVNIKSGSEEFPYWNNSDLYPALNRFLSNEDLSKGDQLNI